MQREIHLFAIADYRLSQDLILRLKKAGITQDHFLKGDHGDYKYGIDSDGVYLDTRGTRLRVDFKKSETVTHVSYEQTLYFEGNALCTTRISGHSHHTYWDTIYYRQPKTIVGYTGALPKSLVAQNPSLRQKEPYFYFLIGNGKPSPLSLAHLSYLGIKEEDCVLKEDGLWYLKISEVSFFEKKENILQRKGVYHQLYFNNKTCVSVHIDKKGEKIVKYSFHVCPFSVTNILQNNRILLEHALAINNYGVGVGIEFTGTIEAFVAGLNRNEIYNCFSLYAGFDAKKYSYEALNHEKAILLCKALENNTHLNTIELYSVTIKNESLILILETVRKLPQFKKIILCDVILDEIISRDTLQHISSLIASTPVFMKGGNIGHSELLNLFSGCFNLYYLRKEETYLRLLPKDISAMLNLFLLTPKPMEEKTEVTLTLNRRP